MSGEVQDGQHPVCPATGGPAVYYGEKNGYRLWRSVNSEIIFVYPLPSKKQLSDYYNSRYFDRDPDRYLNNESSENSVWARRIETIRRLSGVESLQDWTVLDVGAGTGAFLAQVAPQCGEVHAVEYSEDGRRMLAERLGLDEPIPASLEAVEFEEQSFELITMWAVIEHLPFDPGLFVKIRGLLKSGGILALSTPNVQAWNCAWFSTSWRYFTPPEHLMFYGLPTLQMLLEDAGFQLLKNRSIFSQRAFKQGVETSSLPPILKKPLRAAGWVVGGFTYSFSAGDTLEIYARAD